MTSESHISMRFEEHCIRELAFDLGVDARALKQKLASLFSSGGGGSSNQAISDSASSYNGSIDRIHNMHFNI